MVPTKQSRVQLTNSQGFPDDVPKGLIVELGDGRKLRVVRRESSTVLTLGPIRWWHHRYWPPVLAFAFGTLIGFTLQQLMRFYGA